MIKLFRLLGLTSSKKKKQAPAIPVQATRRPMKKAFFIVEMADGQRLGGIYNKKTATWHKNRLIAAGGTLIKFEIVSDKPAQAADPNPNPFANFDQIIQDEANKSEAMDRTPEESGKSPEEGGTNEDE